MQFEAFAHTDTGPVRENNEDYFLVDQENGLFVVADGMGGHSAGEVASLIAVETVEQVLLNEVDPDETRLSRNIMDEEEAIRERLRYAMNQACVKIRQAAIENPAHRGMGTTLTILLIEDGIAHFSHVGDSRLYLFSNGYLRRLTRDHTVVQNEIDAGRLTPELARLAPHKNILTQSVGYHGTVDPVTSTRPVGEGDILLLCSDGLTDPIDDTTLEELIATTPFDDLAFSLVERALDDGGEDNVTVVVVKIIEE